MKREYTYPQERALQAFSVFYFEKAIFPATKAIVFSGFCFFVLEWMFFYPFVLSLIISLVSGICVYIGTFLVLFYRCRRIAEERILRSDLWAWHALRRDLRVTTDFFKNYDELCNNRFLGKERVDAIAEEYTLLHNNALYYLKFFF